MGTFFDNLAQGWIYFWRDGLFKCRDVDFVQSWYEISSFVEKCSKLSWKIDGGEIVDFVGGWKFFFFFLDQRLSITMVLMF